MCQQFGLPYPKLEHRFSDRKFQFDFSWPDKKIALEKEGGIFTRGAHGSVTGILRDIEKYNLASSLGWRILRVTPSNLLRMDTINLIKKAMEWRSVPA